MTTTEPAADAPGLLDSEPAPSTEIERADHPVPMPGPSPMAELATIPDQNELRTLAQLATTFAFSALVPKPLQAKPEDVLLVLLTARDLGLSTTVALRECHPIDGRVTVSPKLKLAIVRQRGLGRIWPDESNNVEHHTWYAARADDPQTVYRVTYTWRDAQRAGLVQSGCTPDEHSDQCQTGRQWGATRAARDKACKTNWVNYPAQMLQWRAMGYLMDQAFGEVGTGLYSADELGAVTDDDGHIIELSEVGPLDGMPDHTPGPKDPAKDPNAPAPQDFRDRCKERIYRLPHPAIETLREQWARRNEQTGEPLLYPLPVLPMRQVRSADALITGFEERAGRGEWGKWNPEPLSWETTQPPATQELRGVEGDAGPQDDPTGPEGDTGPHSDPPADPVPDTEPAPGELVPDTRPYDPKHPPSEVLEAAIDRAAAILDGQLDAELEAVGQTPVVSHKPDTKRRRLCQAWFVAGWVPEGWEPGQ